jgi:hypothetical protein
MRTIASLEVGLLSQTTWEDIPGWVTIQGGRRMISSGRMMLGHLMYVLGGPFGRYGRNIVLISGYEDHAMTRVGSVLYIAMISATESHARKQR